MGKIFISHCVNDKTIGDKFVAFLKSLGFEEKDIFYSSRYHNGVGLGETFSDVVRDNFIESNLIVFLLSQNFYDSPYCLNEMGAAWISTEKKIVPILLGNLEFKDMKGFINSQIKAFSTRGSEKYELLNYFTKTFNIEPNEETYRFYDDFINSQVQEKKIELNSKELEIIRELQKNKTGIGTYMDIMGIVILGINNRQFCSNIGMEEKLEYKEAVENLIELNLLSKHSNYIQLTSKGYTY